MSIKKITQTRWDITADTITIYPYGAVYLICVTFAIIALAMTVFILYPLHEGLAFVPAYLFYIVVILLLWLFARTNVFFDKRQRVMYKRLFGFIKTRRLKFDEISGIMPIRTGRGTFRYYIIPDKSYWWNTGIGISSGFINESSPHAIDLQTHLLSAINECLHKKSNL
ncbi:MAG: hypothetical protein ACXVJD_06425 [Mucilaginibacter sp.]